jgi:cyclic pyranopterin phosphate synthase
MTSHFDSDGNAHMVDVSAKLPTVRQAVASAALTMRAATAEIIRQGTAAKGDVLGTARLAAIGATKQTPLLIPLCHAIPIEAVSVDFSWLETADSDPAVLKCEVCVRTTAKTGVEMEAMTAASIAALTVYDMVKSVDRALAIGPIVLIEKSGGKSGHFRRQHAE